MGQIANIAQKPVSVFNLQQLLEAFIRTEVFIRTGTKCSQTQSN